MSIDIRIDEPGAGEWVMGQLGGVFNNACDHSFSSHRGGEILGGIVLSHFMGASITMHMAARDKRWCSRDLLWIAFDYPFNQLGCHKVLAPIASDNPAAIDIDLRGGWVFETMVRDAFSPGVHLVILSMTKDNCPWLDHVSRSWVPRARNGHDQSMEAP